MVVAVEIGDMSQVSRRKEPCLAADSIQNSKRNAYWADEYFVTAFVPSETACLANSPGRMRRTEVWISREEMVDFLL